MTAGLPGAGLDWLDSIRRKSLERFNRLALPSTRVEAWKYTNLKDLAKTPFEIMGSSAEPESIDLNGLGARRSGPVHRLVFANGSYSAALSDAGNLPDGLVVTNLADALTTHSALVRSHLERISSLEGEALLALNAAFMMNGYVVAVDDGVQLDDPLELVFVSDTASPTSVHPAESGRGGCR